MSKDVLVVIGAGSIGLADARRTGAGKQVLLADFNETTLQGSATALEDAGHTVTTQRVDDGHAAYECIRAGATFLVSPQLNPEMIRVANRYQVPTVSGAFTPTEILESAEAGADIVKLFPTENAGIPYAKAVLAPLAHLPIMPAGGVTTGNVAEWFAAGVAGVGVGSAVTKAWQPDGDFTRVTAAAHDFLAAVQDARR